jgi:endonuclease-3
VQQLFPKAVKRNDINAIVSILKKKTLQFRLPSVSQISQDYKGPFFVLISCLLSLRTKDKTTSEASFRLFRLAKNPSQMLTLAVREIEKAIYPVGFYRTKAKRIKGICKALIEKFSSRVPDSLEDLLTLKGGGQENREFSPD